MLKQLISSLAVSQDIYVDRKMLIGLDGRQNIFAVCSFKANILAISSDTHQLHYIPLHHFTI